jgi:Rps23 Pro-64 3,4-dihydroxylase Tpa1-like proline 4-hydroxylase
MFNQNLFDELKTKGFLELKLENLFPDRFAKFVEISTKLKKTNFINACHTGIDNNWSHNVPFNELEKIKERGLNSNSIWQFWFFDGNLNLYISHEDIIFLKKLITDIRDIIYPLDVLNADGRNDGNIELTLYNKGCFVGPHEDGNGGDKLCNLLIYLNEDYEEGFGGEIVINDNIIKPLLGNIVVLDFLYVNPTHSVNTIVKDGFNRFALITPFFKNEYL